MAGQVTHQITAQKRELTGRKIKKLRKDGILPANISGRDVESITIQVPMKDFAKVYSEVGETGVVSVKIDGKEIPTLIHNVHNDPVTDQPLHADFLQVNLREKVTATVPLEFVGESPAEKDGIGIIVHQMREIEVEALPTDLPESIEVDIAGLAEVDQAIKVSDLKVDRSKVEIKEEDPERIVVSISAPTKEEEPEAPAEGEEGASQEGGEAAAGESTEGAEEKTEE